MSNMMGKKVRFRVRPGADRFDFFLANIGQEKWVAVRMDRGLLRAGNPARGFRPDDELFWLNFAIDGKNEMEISGKLASNR